MIPDWFTWQYAFWSFLALLGIFATAAIYEHISHPNILWGILIGVIGAEVCLTKITVDHLKGKKNSSQGLGISVISSATSPGEDVSGSRLIPEVVLRTTQAVIGAGPGKQIISLDHDGNASVPYLIGNCDLRFEIIKGIVRASGTLTDGTNRVEMKSLSNGKLKFVNKPLDWDINSSSKMMEIVNGDGVCLFQFFAVDGVHVFVQGSFRDTAHEGWLYILSVYQGQFFARSVKEMAFLPDGTGIQPLMKHPGKSSPGQYLDPGRGSRAISDENVEEYAVRILANMKTSFTNQPDKR